MNESGRKLLKIVSEHPDLPIMAYVAYEVVGGDEFSYWTGEVDEAEVQDVWTTPDGETWTRENAECLYTDFADRYAPEEFNDRVFDLPDDEYEKEVKKWIRTLPWKKCILVTIEPLNTNA